MTRKDYILIAKTISDLMADFNNCGDDSVSLALVSQELASALKTDNPRFDTARFLTACGVK
jgi:hypothetical protein